MKPKPQIPPQSAERFLQWFVRDDLAEEVLDDLEEKFYVQLEKKSPFQAKANYRFKVNSAHGCF